MPLLTNPGVGGQNASQRIDRVSCNLSANRGGVAAVTDGDGRHRGRSYWVYIRNAHEPDADGPLMEVNLYNGLFDGVVPVPSPASAGGPPAPAGKHSKRDFGGWDMIASQCLPAPADRTETAVPTSHAITDVLRIQPSDAAALAALVEGMESYVRPKRCRGAPKRHTKRGAAWRRRSAAHTRRNAAWMRRRRAARARRTGSSAPPTPPSWTVRSNWSVSSRPRRRASPSKCSLTAPHPYRQRLAGTHHCGPSGRNTHLRCVLPTAVGAADGGRR